MMYHTHLKGAALAALCTVTLVACEGGMPAPTSPSAVVGSGGAASNPDGSTVKATQPVGLVPTNDSSGLSLTPTLFAQPGVGRFKAPAMPHRFQISVADNFATLTETGFGSYNSQGVMTYTVAAPLTSGTKYFWRVRVELDDQVGPWSDFRGFTTTGTVAAPPAGPSASGSRTPNPGAGQQLPLPNMLSEVLKFSDARDSCPRGIKYVNNPWQDRVVDHLRTFDTRWGYNAKPTRGPADNGGVAVIAAGDEVAYNYTAQPDEGNTRVHLVDMLVQHCGANPTVGWRVFTGEEPGRWTGAGRFQGQ
ncbi:MAG: hypothetical protein RJA55_1106 [Acidobacteriota bacterium]|jgi:hypothetical protein